MQPARRNSGCIPPSTSTYTMQYYMYSSLSPSVTISHHNYYCSCLHIPCLQDCLLGLAWPGLASQQWAVTCAVRPSYSVRNHRVDDTDKHKEVCRCVGEDIQSWPQGNSCQKHDPHCDRQSVSSSHPHFTFPSAPPITSDSRLMWIRGCSSHTPPLSHNSHMPTARLPVKAIRWRTYTTISHPHL